MSSPIVSVALDSRRPGRGAVGLYDGQLLYVDLKTWARKIKFIIIYYYYYLLLLLLLLSIICYLLFIIIMSLSVCLLLWVCMTGNCCMLI